MRLRTVESPLGTATKCSFMEGMCADQACQRARIRVPSWKVLLLEVKQISTQLGVCCVSWVRAEALPKRLD